MTNADAAPNSGGASPVAAEAGRVLRSLTFWRKTPTEGQQQAAGDGKPGSPAESGTLPPQSAAEGGTGRLGLVTEWRLGFSRTCNTMAQALGLKKLQHLFQVHDAARGSKRRPHAFLSHILSCIE